jgi:hypothetical protein
MGFIGPPKIEIATPEELQGRDSRLSESGGIFRWHARLPGLRGQV